MISLSHCPGDPLRFRLDWCSVKDGEEEVEITTSGGLVVARVTGADRTEQYTVGVEDIARAALKAFRTQGAAS